MNESALIVSLISNATLPVQVVMVLLGLASLMAWFWIFQRYFVISRAHRAWGRFEREMTK